jgi:hypothetical protein
MKNGKNALDRFFPLCHLLAGISILRNSVPSRKEKVKGKSGRNQYYENENRNILSLPPFLSAFLSAFLSGPGSVSPRTGLLRQSIHAWLVRTPMRVVLVDTATGNDKDRHSIPILNHLNEPFLDRLKAAGARPRSPGGGLWWRSRR